MDTTLTFRHLDSPDDWTRAFDVVKKLQPHLTDPDAFCTQLRRQHEENYRLLAACNAEGTILGLHAATSYLAADADDRTIELRPDRRRPPYKNRLRVMVRQPPASRRPVGKVEGAIIVTVAPG